MDNDPATRWHTGGEQTPGQWFQIELPVDKEIGGVMLDAARSGHDYPRGYKLELSENGIEWKKAAEGKGNNAVLEIMLPKPQTTKFIRITQTGTGEKKGTFWSIHELELLLPAQSKL